MKNAIHIFKFLFITILVICVIIPALVYALVSLPVVQSKIKDTAEKELSSLLALPVSIESVGIAPFNRLVIRGVNLTDSLGTDTIAHIRRLDAGVRLSSLFSRGALTIEYAALIDAGFFLKRETPESPLNAQPMFDALKGGGQNKNKSFALAVNTIVIRQSKFSYDVMSADINPKKFCKDHIGINDLRADISLRKIELPPGDINLVVNRIAFDENAGFTLKDLHFSLSATDSTLLLSGLGVELPQTSLLFNNLSIPCGIKDLAKVIKNTDLVFSVMKGSYVSPSDFSAFEPHLTEFKQKYDFSMFANGSLAERMNVELRIDDNNKDFLNISADCVNLDDFNNTKISITSLNANVLTNRFRSLLQNNGLEKLEYYKRVGLSLNGYYSTDKATADLKIKIDDGSEIRCKIYSKGKIGNLAEVKSDIILNNIDISPFVKDLKNISAKLDLDASVGKSINNATFNMSEGTATYKGYAYNSITAGGKYNDDCLNAEATIYDPNAKVIVTLGGCLTDKVPDIKTNVIASNLNLYRLNLITNDKFRNYNLAFDLSGSYHGKKPEDALADLKIRNLSFISTDPDEHSLKLNMLKLEMNGLSESPYITLRSDYVDADVIGPYNFSTIKDCFSELLAYSMPALCKQPDSYNLWAKTNNFKYDINLKYSEELTKFLKLPVSVIYPVNINGFVDQSHNSFDLKVDAPYLLQKNKIIENTSLYLSVDSTFHAARLLARSSIPTKDGLNNVNLSVTAENNRIDTDVSWKIDRKKIYKGEVSLSTAVSRNIDTDELSATVSLNPSSLVFNDSIWNVKPAEIHIEKDRYVVDGLEVIRSNQFVMANGVVSKDPDESLTLSLLNFNLDYLFESLGLDNVRIGGDATGLFHASDVLSKEPRLLTDNLKVRDISFNKTVFGNADIKSRWDIDKKGVMIDAVIVPENEKERKTFINGGIFPMADSLDLHFNADRIDASFLLTYMKAFATDVKGYASGKARIYGNFKYIDLCGDLLAEDFSIKLGITNTSYLVKKDSIHITPGNIPLNDMTIYDSYGNTARLNGYVRHKFFKDASFKINMTDARRLLCFNITPEINDVWNGKVFADGTLFLNGEPEYVNINADLKTAPGSSFNLTLSDAEDAGEYHFIKFNDLTPDTIGSNEISGAPDIISSIRKRLNAVVPSSKSSYNVDLHIDVTPDAGISLVLSPDSPDRIKARGEGNLRIVYTSDGITSPDGTSDRTEDMKIYGTYEVEKGSYYFTLQDIIVKDFIIKPGSTITFTGNPDGALLDLSAYYLVNANLTDLDESFAQDKDLNRTNVPVHAILNVDGDIRQPEISFNLEFPTLNSDIDRKVRSIVSTDEMMSTQIIYLLALNRFYTPEYMSSATKGNEFVSVASSTLSSRLSGLLGGLSENWRVAPNIRSDRGDFSDMEVDLALSSSLLNNRLLINGNLGYRDNSLNTNTNKFVGDFDIEYLLNRSGNIRLKAYNRYNDQNFYLKTATTTQGVGILYKIDFDNLFKFTPPKRERSKTDSTDHKKQIIIY